MNLEWLIKTVINQFVRKLINLALHRGVNMAAERIKPSSELNESERAQGVEAQKMGQKFRDMHKGGRRLF
jgi:hypothetical protein